MELAIIGVKMHQGDASLGTAQNIQAVRQAIAQNPRISARRNPLPNISSATFNRITRQDLQMYPYRIQMRHALFPADLIRRRNFCNWFVGRGLRTS